jgi:hypothetical protein
MGFWMRAQLNGGTLRGRMARFSVVAGLILSAACSTGNPADWNQPGALSPDGTAKARLLDMAGAYQVYISFDRGSCGAGSFSARDALPSDIKLAWRNSETLEASVPHGLKLDTPPGATSVVHRVQCRDRVVRVELVRR